MSIFDNIAKQVLTAPIEWDFVSNRPVTNTICWRCGDGVHTSELKDKGAPDGPMCPKCFDECEEGEDLK